MLAAISAVVSLLSTVGFNSWIQLKMERSIELARSQALAVAETAAMEAVADWRNEGAFGEMQARAREAVQEIEEKFVQATDINENINELMERVEQDYASFHSNRVAMEEIVAESNDELDSLRSVFAQTNQDFEDTFGEFMDEIDLELASVVDEFFGQIEAWEAGALSEVLDALAEYETWFQGIEDELTERTDEISHELDEALLSLVRRTDAIPELVRVEVSSSLESLGEQVDQVDLALANQESLATDMTIRVSQLERRVGAVEFNSQTTEEDLQEIEIHYENRFDSVHSSIDGLVFYLVGGTQIEARQEFREVILKADSHVFETFSLDTVIDSDDEERYVHYVARLNRDFRDICLIQLKAAATSRELLGWVDCSSLDGM